MDRRIQVYEDATLRLWSERELLLAAWFDAPTRSQMLELHRAGRALAQSHAGAGLANVIVRGVPRFADDVRDEGIRIARERTFRKGSCHVVLVQGLGGAAARAFMSMVLLVGTRALGKGSARAKVFGDVDDAASWFAPVLGAGWSPPALAKTFRQIADKAPPAK